MQEEGARRRRILVVAGPGVLGEAAVVTVSGRGFEVVRARTAAEAASSARDGVDAAVVLLPNAREAGAVVLAQLKEVDAHLGVVVVGDDASLPSPVEAFELGAAEHLGANAPPAELLAALGVILGSRRGDRHLHYLRSREASEAAWSNVIGDSPALRRVTDVLRRVCERAPIGAAPTIFLGGETGTGKGFLARCIHYNGPRRTRPFVEVNCAALPPGLVESELFGHERGSFTDAKGARAGLFETAEGGTLFLDEIGAVPLDVQAKLLTALEEKRVRRIGARKSQTVDVQIVAATHENLVARVRQGTFREDLYHRLHVVAVTMPALRERGRDVVLLAEGFLDRFCREYAVPPRRLDSDAVIWLQSYGWPGNVRELRNQIERIVLLESDEMVRRSHFVCAATESGTRPAVRLERTETGELSVSLPPGGVDLELLEREILRSALAACQGNVSAAARFLRITRQTLIYRLKKHGLDAHGAPESTGTGGRD